MHAVMLVWLKVHSIEFLKVKLTHPNNAIVSRITSSYIHLNQTRTGLKQSVHDR